MAPYAMEAGRVSVSTLDNDETMDDATCESGRRKADVIEAVRKKANMRAARFQASVESVIRNPPVESAEIVAVMTLEDVQAACSLVEMSRYDRKSFDIS